MEYKNIKDLIEKYWAGETDLQEESTLKTYFSSADVHPSLTQYKPLFSYFQEAKEEVHLDSIEAAVMEQIQHKAVPTEAKVISIGRILKVAAAVLVLMGATTFFYKQIMTNESERIVVYDEESEKLEAYLELKAALALVSNKIDNGKQQAIKGLSRTKTISIIK
jgi:hypothetical protein